MKFLVRWQERHNWAWVFEAGSVQEAREAFWAQMAAIPAKEQAARYRITAVEEATPQQEEAARGLGENIN